MNMTHGNPVDGDRLTAYAARARASQRALVRNAMYERLPLSEFLDREQTPWRDGCVDALTETGTAFGLDIRRAARVYHKGWSSRAEFAVAVEQAIRSHLMEAWTKGLASVGILWDEQSMGEKLAFQAELSRQIAYIDGLIDFVQSKREKSWNTVLPTVKSRIAIWANRWNEFYHYAAATAGKDQKLVWVLGQTEKHCVTCLALAGKVKRASQWYAHGLLPQSPRLACGGFHCDCRLETTDAPMSKGPLPTRGSSPKYAWH